MPNSYVLIELYFEPFLLLKLSSSAQRIFSKIHCRNQIRLKQSNSSSEDQWILIVITKFKSCHLVDRSSQTSIFCQGYFFLSSNFLFTFHRIYLNSFLRIYLSPKFLTKCISLYFSFNNSLQFKFPCFVIF